MTARSSTREVPSDHERRHCARLRAVPGAEFTFRIDANGRRSVQFVGDGVHALLGLTSAEVMADPGRACALVRPDAIATVEDSIRRSRETLSPWMPEIPVTSPTGETRWIGGHALPAREPDGATVWHGVLLDITEYKLVELSLRESRQRYERVVQHIGDALLIQDCDGLVRFANQRFRDLFGIDEATSLRDVMPDDYVGPEWRKRLRILHAHRVRGDRSPAKFEFEAIRADGRRMWLEAIVVPIEDEGVVVGTQAAIHDLTDRKQVEDAVQLLSAGLASTADTPVNTALAQRMADLLNVEIAFIAELVPGHPSRLRTLVWTVDGQPAAPTECDLADSPAEAVASGKSCVFESGVADLFPADRALADLGVSGYAGVPLFDEGKPCGVIGVMSRRPLRQAGRMAAILHLFSVRASAELERQRQDARFHDLFEFSPDATVIVDRHGHITAANERAETVSGYPRAELLTMTVGQLISMDADEGYSFDCRDFLAAQVPPRRDVRRSAMRARRRDGTVFPVEVGMAPLHAASDRQLVAVIRDVTERVQNEARRRALEDRLRQGRKMESLGTLAGGIAHDFNNLLAIINGHAELVLASTPDGDERRGSVAEILRAGRRGAALTDQILSFSRHHVRELKVIDVNSVLADMHGMLTRLVHPGVTLTIVPGADIGRVQADPEQVGQVIMNLTTNASDAMPDGGTLTIETASTQIGEAEAVDLPGLVPGRYVIIRVTDTGIGMNASTREALFEPFFTTKAPGKGTGLGLSIVYGIVRQAGGAISVESALRRGATFTIYLPQTGAAVSESVARGGQVLVPGTETVVVVDDDQAIARMTGEILATAGYSALVADGGDAALRLVERDHQPVDVLLTDVVMPGMSGPALAARLAAARPGMKVVYMSGFTDTVDALGASHDKSAGFLSKPFTAATLTRKIRDALDSVPLPA